MTNFSREIKNLASIKAQWVSNGDFLNKIKTDYVEKGKAILTFRKDQATVYYNGNQLCNIAGPSFTPTVNELFLPLLRSNILEKRSTCGNDKHEYIEESEWKIKADIQESKIHFSDILSEICSNITAAGLSHSKSWR